MQQRVNNLWLSEQLIDAVASQRSHDRNALAETPSSTAPTTSTLRSTRQSHRKMWQHIATALLLVGSAAFSYLAWSQSDLLAVSLPAPEASPILTETHRGPAETSPTNTPHQAEVNKLRVLNRNLQLRIAELEDALGQ